MSTSVKQGVYEFRKKLNSFNSGRGNDIDLVDVISYLNEGYQRWYDRRLSVAQRDSKSRDDLRVFKEDKVSLELKKIDSETYEAKYPKDLYKRLNQLGIATKDCCPNIKKYIPIRILQSDDLQDARKNPNRKSDFFYEQVISTEYKDGILIYTDSAFDLEKVLIDYYRRPKEVHAPSLMECDDDQKYYDYAGRTISQDVNFEIEDTFALNDIVDISVLCAIRDSGDIQGFNTQINKILGIQNLSIDREN